MKNIKSAINISAWASAAKESASSGWGWKAPVGFGLASVALAACTTTANAPAETRNSIVNYCSVSQTEIDKQIAKGAPIGYYVDLTPTCIGEDNQQEIADIYGGKVTEVRAMIGLKPNPNDSSIKLKDVDGNQKIDFFLYHLDNGKDIGVFPDMNGDYKKPSVHEVNTYISSNDKDKTVEYSWGYRDPNNKNLAITFFTVSWPNPNNLTQDQILSNYISDPKFLESLGNPTRIIISNPDAKEDMIIDLQPDNTWIKKLLDLTTTGVAHAQGLPTETPAASTLLPPTETPRPPTKTPTPLPPTATATPTATENPSRNALLGLGYTEKDLEGITNISEGTYSFTNDKGEVDSVIYTGYIGTKADGTKEILAFKFSDLPLIKLSGTELANYAKEACTGSCFEEYYSGGPSSNHSMDINSVSTGVIVQFEKDVGGKKIIFKTGLMATRTDQGIPVPFLAILQMEDASNPGVDLLENNFLWSSGLVTSLSNEVHSVEEWKGIIPKGKHIKPGVRYVISSSVRIDGFSLFRDEFADEDYLKTLQSFFDSNGSERTSNLIIVIPAGVEFTK